MMNGQRHLHLRKRDARHLEPYPHPNAFIRFFDKVMYAVALGGPLAMVPQVIQLFATKDAVGLSIITWFAWLLFSVAWLGYGIIHRELPIILAQGLYILLHILVVVGIVIYG